MSAPTAAPSATAEATASLRPIDGIYGPPPLHWVGDGFRVAGYFSAIPDAVRRLSPFLMLDYHPPHTYSPTTKRRGVGVHPHRGFETVTLAWEGRIAHHDSSGGGGVIGPGDVQWMTAASGILHKEYHEESFGREGGRFHMAQLWVNLPRSHKMTKPRYQPLVASAMGRLELPGGAGLVRIIAGELGGVRGPAETVTPMRVLDASLKAGALLELPLPGRENTAVLVMSGSVKLQGATRARASDFVLFKNEGHGVRIEAEEDAHLLVLSGEPIDEPVVQYGPFVMSTRREIEEALYDFQSGKFGYLAD